MKETGEKVSGVTVLMLIGAVMFIVSVLLVFVKFMELQNERGIQFQVYVQPYIIIACTGVIVFSLGLAVRALIEK